VHDGSGAEIGRSGQGEPQSVGQCCNRGAMPNRLSARSRSRNMYARSVTSVVEKAMNPDANGTMNCLLATSKCGLRV
jgi:hypothetical protein